MLTFSRIRRSTVLAENQSRYDEDITEEYSFDELAREVGEGALTRGRVLKLIGAALVGSLGAFVGISAGADAADAKRKKKRRGSRAVIIPALSCGSGTLCTNGTNTRCCPAGTICCNALDGNGITCCDGILQTCFLGICV